MWRISPIGGKMTNVYDLFESDDPEEITAQIMDSVEELLYTDRHGSDNIMQLMEDLEERIRFLAGAN